MPASRAKSAWLILAIASGACAAFNGVFAKLTTTELTSSWASAVSKAFALNPSNKIVEFSIRGLFFALNLVFNGVMWGLFTRALTLASSTVRVSVINTSANFMITAVLGALIFSEALPGMWWLGAALLVTGSVIIGRREEGNKPGLAATSTPDPLLEGSSVDGSAFSDADDGQERVELRSVDNGKSSSEDEDEDEDNVLK